MSSRTTVVSSPSSTSGISDTGGGGYEFPVLWIGASPVKVAGEPRSCRFRSLLDWFPHHSIVAAKFECNVRP